MAKDKIDAKVVREGKNAVMFQVKAKAKGFGSMKCQIDYHLEDEKMAEAVLDAGIAAEELLDNMEVDPTDEASVAAYIQACGTALLGIMNAIKDTLAK